MYMHLDCVFEKTNPIHILSHLNVLGHLYSIFLDSSIFLYLPYVGCIVYD